MRSRLFLLLAMMIALVSCKEHQISNDPSLRLSFSKDTVSFDTVFTTIGSSTLRLMIYNPNANALSISRVWQDKGNDFLINVDGETRLENLQGLEIGGGDSLFAFIKVTINPTKENNAVLVEDNLHFVVNNHVQTVHLEAYGQDVHLIKSAKRLTVLDSYVFANDKPYLIYDTVAIENALTFQPGARLYFHDKATLFAYGSVSAIGTLKQPIVLQGDRIDHIFDSVPYAHVGGMWSGVYLLDKGSTAPKTYTFEHVHILSANMGLYCVHETTTNLPKLRLSNSRIHNHAVYGLLAQNTDAEVINCELSNAASYCAYLAGGRHRFVHSTIASYFNSTNIRIQSTPHKDVAAVYINYLSKNLAPTHTSFQNCIVSGIRQNNLLVATPLPQYYTDTIAGNYLKADSLKTVHAFNNIYWQKDDTIPVFVNTYYKYKEYVYYDFRLDSLSPARGIADSVIASQYPFDRLGNPRTKGKPDAGCYQFLD